jgi:hypothetical protein
MSASKVRAHPGFLALALFALVALAALYFALTARDGIISTNDGSHYALTKALAADRTASIDPYVNYAAIQPQRGTPTAKDYRDLSYYNGHFYSDRPPGTALLAVPFYWLGLAADAVSGRQDLDFPLRFVTMLPPLLGVATVLALALLARGLGAGWRAATATAAIGGLTTLVLKYATLLYSHITGAAFVTGALAAVLLAERAGRWRGWILALGGALLGYSAVAEYPNLLLIAPVGAYIVGRGTWNVGRGATLRSTLDALRPSVLPFALGWLAPVALLLGYNWAVFGRPWHTSYTYQYYFEWSRSVGTTYILRPGYIAEGLRWLLVGPAGLLTVTPLLAVALWGLVLLARRSPSKALLLAGVVLIILLPTAAHRTYKGGGSQDTRYLLAIVPTLLAPLAIWFERVVWPAGRRGAERAARLALLVPVVALCAWGLLRSYLSLLTMFGHRAVERPPRQAWEILRANWRELDVVAPGHFLLHYFVVLVVPLAVAIWLAVVASWWGNARSRRGAAEGKTPA